MQGGYFMTIEDKEMILRSIFDKTDLIDEKDKQAVVAYIRGTADTRERVRLENETKYATKSK
nr:MAG: hypothetical protein [Bacteriophage sp.]